jgi:hypothetical protein
MYIINLLFIYNLKTNIEYNFCKFNIKMIKDKAIIALKNKLLIKINEYYEQKDKLKNKIGRPKSVSNLECLNAIFLCSY